MSYTLCPRCNQKALSIATRCPHCGSPFETQHSYEPSGSRLREPWVVFAIIALVVIYFGVDAFRRGPAATVRALPALSAGMDPPPVPGSKPARAVPPAGRASQAARESAPRQAPGVPLAARASPESSWSPLSQARAVPLAERPSPASSDLPPRAPDPVAAESPATEPGAAPQERRYTTIWANVREARRPMAAVVTVLEPGEPVLVDSLREEWYRVVEDGQKVGYVYSGLVARTPPGTRN